MVLHILRALFVLLMAAAGWAYLEVTWLAMSLALGVAVLLVCIDVLAPRRKLAFFSGTFFGLLVGSLIAYAFSFIVPILIDQVVNIFDRPFGPGERDRAIQFINVAIGIICSYLAISFILQTKDDFRFIIPYVEFSKATKGARPFLLDTSVLIDGRIADIAGTGIIVSQLIVPNFVMEELQLLADSSDRLKRGRGRRGLEVSQKLKRDKGLDVIFYASHDRPDAQGLDVDQRLVSLAMEINGRILTTDYGLNKVAQLRGAEVVNLNEMGRAFKAGALPGDRLRLEIVKPGEGPRQGVGYLEDGTMVVIEGAREMVGEEVDFLVTNAVPTAAGKIVFGKVADEIPSVAPPSPSAPSPPRARTIGERKSTPTPAK